jgi:hypothetical protein
MTEILRANNLDNTAKILEQQERGGLDVEPIANGGARFVCKRRDGRPFFTFELDNARLKVFGEGCLKIAAGNAGQLIIPGSKIR